MNKEIESTSDEKKLQKIEENEFDGCISIAAIQAHNTLIKFKNLGEGDIKKIEHLKKVIDHQREMEKIAKKAHDFPRGSIENRRINKKWIEMKDNPP